MSEFTTSGKEYPHLHADREKVREVVEFSDERLLENIQNYIEFIRDPNTFPPHKERATEILNHLLFERLYRSGTLDKLFNLGGDDEAIEE